MPSTMSGTLLTTYAGTQKQPKLSRKWPKDKGQGRGARGKSAQSSSARPEEWATDDWDSWDNWSSSWQRDIGWEDQDWQAEQPPVVAVLATEVRLMPSERGAICAGIAALLK